MLALLTVMVSTPATSVHAGNVGRPGLGKVKSISQAYTGGTSQVYAHLITRADGTKVRYVYSSLYLNAAATDGSEDTFGALKSVLTAEFAALIPDKVDESRNGQLGFFFCSDPSLEQYVNENWTSAEYVARNILTTNKEGTSYTYKCEGEGAGGAVNTSATAARQNKDNRFELIKTLAEKTDKARWEADGQQRPYAQLDFGELTGDDIQGIKDMTDSQIDLTRGCNLQETPYFIDGKLVYMTRIEIIDHVATIYSENAMISESPAATVKEEPKPKSLTYTGSAQELVTAGTAEGGVMQYALGTDATTALITGWSTSIPTGTNVGTYYVWYKVVGDETHSDSGVAGPVKVVINEPEPEKTYKVKYEYKDAANLPEDVIATIPADSTAYRDGATVQAKDPTSGSVTVSDGVWTFMGWDAASKKINKSDVTFTGTWEFTKNEEPAPAPREEQMGEDGTPYGPGASEEAVEKAITENKSEKDPKGTKFAPLKVRSTNQTNKKITVQWNKAKGAKKYVVYGNKCGTKNKMVKLKTTTKKKVSFTKIAGKKVKKGTYYKFMVVALDKNNDVVSSSKIIHVATKGGKNGNATKLTVNEPKKAKATLKVKKTLKIKAKQTTSKGAKIKEHVKLRYESSNKQVATVDSNGKVKAKAKGNANITVYTQNGLNKVIKVTVK